MAMISRAERNIDFSHNKTPAVVGPGAYIGETTTAGKAIAPTKPNFAGFASSVPRDDKSVDASRNPGPGTYKPEKTNQATGKSLLGISADPNTKGTNAFASTAAKFAPLFPGSTPFTVATNVETPGPGTYVLPPSLKSAAEKKKTAKERANKQTGKALTSSRLLVAPEFNPPSVPTTLSKGPFANTRGFREEATTTMVPSYRVVSFGAVGSSIGNGNGSSSTDANGSGSLTGGGGGHGLVNVGGSDIMMPSALGSADAGGGNAGGGGASAGGAGGGGVSLMGSVDSSGQFHEGSGGCSSSLGGMAGAPRTRGSSGGPTTTVLSVPSTTISVKPKPRNPEVITGLGQDTVGPAAYTPHAPFGSGGGTVVTGTTTGNTQSGAGASADLAWSRSKSEAKDSLGVPRDLTPGPGQYETHCKVTSIHAPPRPPSLTGGFNPGLLLAATASAASTAASTRKQQQPQYQLQRQQQIAAALVHGGGVGSHHGGGGGGAGGALTGGAAHPPPGRSSAFASTAPRMGVKHGSATTVGAPPSATNASKHGMATGYNGLGPGAYIGAGGVGDTVAGDERWQATQERPAAAAFGAHETRASTFLGNTASGKSRYNMPGPGSYHLTSTSNPGGGGGGGGDLGPSSSFGQFDFAEAKRLTDRLVGFSSSAARPCLGSFDPAVSALAETNDNYNQGVYASSTATSADPYLRPSKPSSSSSSSQHHYTQPSQSNHQSQGQQAVTYGSHDSGGYDGYGGDGYGGGYGGGCGDGGSFGGYGGMEGQGGLEAGQGRVVRSAPGPGYYNVDAVNGLATGFEGARRRAVGRNGVFGTTDKRFNPANMPPQYGGGGGGLKGVGGYGSGPGTYELGDASNQLGHPGGSHGFEGPRGESTQRRAQGSTRPRHSQDLKPFSTSTGLGLPSSSTPSPKGVGVGGDGESRSGVGQAGKLLRTALGASARDVAQSASESHRQHALLHDQLQNRKRRDGSSSSFSSAGSSLSESQRAALMADSGGYTLVQHEHQSQGAKQGRRQRGGSQDGGGGDGGDGPSPVSYAPELADQIVRSRSAMSNLHGNGNGNSHHNESQVGGGGCAMMVDNRTAFSSLFPSPSVAAAVGRVGGSGGVGGSWSHSADKRFHDNVVLDVVLEPDHPGPSAYQAVGARRSSLAPTAFAQAAVRKDPGLSRSRPPPKTSLSNASRFTEASSSNHAAQVGTLRGPGAYSTASSWVTKTHNVTFTRNTRA